MKTNNRKQRAQPDHDPNTQHVLCGADADLIMLGLATHEPNFTIIREEFKPNQPRPCDMCRQMGHEMVDCLGAPKPIEGKFLFFKIYLSFFEKYKILKIFGSLRIFFFLFNI